MNYTDVIKKEIEIEYTSEMRSELEPDTVRVYLPYTKHIGTIFLNPEELPQFSFPYLLYKKWGYGENTIIYQFSEVVLP